MSVALCRPLGVAIALALGLVTQAWSHARLEVAAPLADSTVSSAPSEVRLQFSENVELMFTGLTLAHVQGSSIATGPARLSTSDTRELIVPITGRLEPGSYMVEWHALASDGHKTGGRYVFTVKP